MTTESKDEWIGLESGKEFSRLLYTNPVAFLVVEQEAEKEERLTDGTTTIPSCRDKHSPPSQRQQQEQREVPIENDQQKVSTVSSVPPARRNVQVISWLTATNNDGSFVFSINHRRYTTSMLLPNQQNDNDTAQQQQHHQQQPPKTFVLSIPVHGMEELVLAVGSSSGRFGSKFPKDYVRIRPNDTDGMDDNKDPNTTREENAPKDRVQHNQDKSSQNEKLGAGPTSKKQKRRKHPRFPEGIPGLELVWLEASKTTPSYGGIVGCCAHLYCRVVHCMAHPDTQGRPNGSARTGTSCVPDGADPTSHAASRTAPRVSLDRQPPQQHFLVVAQVQAAHVHRNYWQTRNKLFCPLDSTIPPYLTFYGSQTFGYVCAEPHHCGRKQNT